MPSKDMSAKLKEYQASVNVEATDAILTKWIASIPASLATADQLETLSIQVQGQEASKDKAPDAVFEAVMAYRMLLQNIAKDLIALRDAIRLRIPEIKEEDNLGVNVQILVLEALKTFADGVSGGGKDGSGVSIPSVTFAKDYLSGRATLEDKVLGGGEKEGPSKSQSLLKQLALYDADTVARLSRAYREVVSAQQSTLALFTLNSKKLFAPRVERSVH